MKILLVGGAWDDKRGRKSGYIDKLYRAIDALGFVVQCFNGGAFEALRILAESETFAAKYDAVLWFADVSNEMEKVVEEIKRKHPRCILVTSKRNEFQDDNSRQYGFQEVMQHALKLKSNLVVQFWHFTTPMTVPIVMAAVHDPLGNQYSEGTDNVGRLARVLLTRCQQLRSFTRQGSHQVGDALDVPDQPEFFPLVKQYADTFHQLLQPAQTSRFLGNSSFRCARGFPSFRANADRIFVSRRNIDKRYIEPDNFVAVNANEVGRVEYYGAQKPSVDTPIQLRLYRYYRNINFMLHGHVYVKGAVDINPYDNPIPCGAIEEALQLCYADRDVDQLIINIKHHGCLVMASTAKQLQGLEFQPRPAPEVVC